MTDLEQLVPGTRYRLRFSDCCVEGEIVATFVEYELLDVPSDPDHGTPVAARFDVGTIGPLWGQWTAEPV